MNNIVIEYMPSENEKETEKMIDDLRVLGLEELRLEMLREKKDS